MLTLTLDVGFGKTWASTTAWPKWSAPNWLFGIILSAINTRKFGNRCKRPACRWLSKRPSNASASPDPPTTDSLSSVSLAFLKYPKSILFIFLTLLFGFLNNFVDILNISRWCDGHPLPSDDQLRPADGRWGFLAETLRRGRAERITAARPAQRRHLTSAQPTTSGDA